MGLVLYEDNLKLLTRSRRFGGSANVRHQGKLHKHHEASLVSHLAQVVVCRYGDAGVK